MLNINLMNNPENLYSEIIDFHTKENEYDEEHKDESLFRRRL